MESLKQTIKERFELVKQFSDKGYCVCSRCHKEKPTRLVDGVKTYDLYAECKCGHTKYELRELAENHDYVLKVLRDLATAYKSEIHDFLVPSELPDKETEIRIYIKEIYATIIPFLERQLKKLLPEATRAQYIALYDDFSALVAFRHFETFTLYIDKHVYGGEIFTPARHLFKGFYYFANSMALKKDVRFIEKQCFAGAGKSATDSVFMTWLFGLDIDNDVLKIFGSKDNVVQTMDMVTEIMRSPAYAKIFPYYAKFNCDENQIFSSLKVANGELKINGSKKAVNLRVRSKFDKCDGVRAKFLFLDDITLADDAEKVERHNQDIYLYTSRWFKRKYDLNNFFIIASGTTYHQEDILSYLKNIYGVDGAKPTKFKFTSLGISNEIVKGGLSAFCVIYGLDENDKSTFEEKFPTDTFLLEREKNPRNFEAMVQQNPQPPEGSPFDYDNLPNTYGTEGIPHLPDRTQEVCRASLDPARKGKDFHSMPIIVTIEGRPYLQDVICEQCAPDKIYSKIVDKIEQHRIVQLDIENNTDVSLKKLIQKLLEERGITFCLVTDFQTNKKKDEKIADCETAIKSVYFPRREVYSPNSQMGKFMYWLTAYNYDKPPKHDDPPDSMANYAQRFIMNKQRGAKVTLLKGRRYA